MRLVFSLREKLERDPKYVATVQARTLDSRDLPGGLKGVFGLFGSAQWWQSIADGTMPTRRLTGVIASIYREGMHGEGRGFSLAMPDGSTYRYSCIANQKADLERYVVGKLLAVVYATEPLKNPIEVEGGCDETDADTVLEIAIEE